jgi:brefeldin A-resistance guanine nucleotide exchange factor 1
LTAKLSKTAPHNLIQEYIRHSKKKTRRVLHIIHHYCTSFSLFLVSKKQGKIYRKTMAPMINTGTSNSSPPISDSDNSSNISHIGPPLIVISSERKEEEEEEGQEKEKEKDPLVIGKVVNNKIITMNKDDNSEDNGKDNSDNDTDVDDPSCLPATTTAAAPAAAADVVVCDLDELKNINRNSVEENKEAILQDDTDTDIGTDADIGVVQVEVEVEVPSTIEGNNNNDEEQLELPDNNDESDNTDNKDTNGSISVISSTSDQQQRENSSMDGHSNDNSYTNNKGDNADDDDADADASSSSKQQQQQKKSSSSSKKKQQHRNHRKHKPPTTTSAAAAAGTAPTSLLIRSNNVCKVIKGEIHNVLNVMRTDPRCASPLRFVEEMPTDEQHPLFLRFRELHRSMTEWELKHPDDLLEHQAPDARMYLPPFCVAIQSRDISVNVTGAALQSLQKFLLYGFLSNEGPNAFTTIANTLLLCTFEENNNSGGGGGGNNSNNNNDHTGRDDSVGKAGGGGGGRNSNANPTATTIAGGGGFGGERPDEQVVLRLLDLSALIVRSASIELKPDVVVGLLDICLHVSHRAKRASPLLKSAASDAMKQIVLEIFSKPNLARKREDILAKLATLLNPNQNQNNDAYVINSLTLVNFALETLTPDKLTSVEIGILQKDLCKYLLSWSTTHDLVILSLTMRVIFNLFQTIRNHLKVPLEVFLTSVHLRILEHSGNPEEREVALESLLEFCREPALIKDLYLNYDCDVQCTNLYANICTTLGNVASPHGYHTIDMMTNDGHNHSSLTERNNLVAINRRKAETIARKAAAAASDVPMNCLNVLALESLLTIIESISRRCKNHNNSNQSDGASAASATSNSGVAADSGPRQSKSSEKGKARFYTHSSSSASVDLDDLEMSEDDLQERKRRKAALARLATVFNKDPFSKEWINIGIELNILEETPESVALALYTAPGLDKDELGTYMGKGPVDKYPFLHDVRLEFVKHFDFSNCGRFASALRVFLHKFRLPGEAQQIDRIMDAFSKEYYKQQGSKTVFKNSDSVFVLAFSTIMLNTDLHNPNIKNMKRMTRQQFIRNNRGINGGGDLPEAMLAWLYTDIREQELQVQREIGEFISHSDALDAEHFRGAWGDMLRKNVAAAVFTTADEARRTMFEAGVHEKDMFLVICKPALRAISSGFVRSWDDGNIVSALKGLEQMAKIATFFALDDLLNEIISFLLVQGRDYIVGCVALEYAGIESGAPINQDNNDDESTMASMSIVDPDSPIPYALLRVREIARVDTKKTDINGAAAYRGLLALNMGLRIVRTLFPRVRQAWPELIEVFGSLRDARALPAGLSDLDDFADSDGNVLRLSLFARNSQKRLDDSYRIKAGKKGTTKQGWFGGRLSVFGRAKGKEVEASGNKPHHQSRTATISPNAKILLQIAEWTEIEKFMVLGPHLRTQLVKQSLKRLLDSIDEIPSKPSPTYEQHQAFALELAARTLLESNEERAQELFPLFLTKFHSIAQKLSKLERPVPVPFLVERVVVTILRSSIHLYKIPTVSRLFFIFVSVTCNICEASN